MSTAICVIVDFSLFFLTSVLSGRVLFFRPSPSEIRNEGHFSVPSFRAVLSFFSGSFLAMNLSDFRPQGNRGYIQSFFERVVFDRGTFPERASRWLVSTQTIKRWVNRFYSQQSLEPDHHNSGRYNQMTPDEVFHLLWLTHSLPSVTGREAVKFLSIATNSAFEAWDISKTLKVI